MAILKKLKKGLKKAAKVAIPVGAALLAARAMKRRGEMKDFLATEGGNKSDMRTYFSNGTKLTKAQKTLPDELKKKILMSKGKKKKTEKSPMSKLVRKA